MAIETTGTFGLDTMYGACANCGPPSGRGYGQDRAWWSCCQDCTDLLAGQMEVVHDRPDGQPIQILRCTWCSRMRACRPGWATRCHVCLDDRTSEEWFDPTELDAVLANPDWSDEVREFAGLDAGQQISQRDVHEYHAASYLDRVIDVRARPHWTVLAADVWGLPWVESARTTSHGTWAVHDACGTVQKLPTGRVECRVCPPEPDSRSNRARRDDPHLLYLVRNRGWKKFGRGYKGRVNTHLAEGAVVIQVIRARYEDVAEAESQLCAQHRSKLRRRRRGLPKSFGTGTEVVPASTRIDLTEWLDGDDVTHWFEGSE